MKFILSLGTVLVLSFSAMAQDAPLPLVALELQQDNLAFYKERREVHGTYVGFSYEALHLKNFISVLDARDYAELFGDEPIPLMRLTLDYKYNFFMGAVAAGLEFGKGSLSDNLSGEDRTLDVTKYGLGFRYIADVIWNEPYAAPYLGINLWQMEVAESSPSESFSASTQLGLNYTFGILLQLDWIDQDSAKNATFQWGLENTFVDLYVTQYAKTAAVDDPNTETELLYGGGLRLEF